MIIKTLLLCAQQNIAIRGHVEEKSNFTAILRILAILYLILSCVNILKIRVQGINTHLHTFKMSYSQYVESKYPIRWLMTATVKYVLQ